MKSFEVNLKTLGHIHAMPRKVYWIGMPESFKEKERIELLQKDIWVIRHPIEKLAELSKESDVILFINLDKTLFTGRTVVSTESLVAKKLIDDVNAVKPLHTILHTTHINPKFNEIFSKASFTYLEKNLHDTASAIVTAIKTVNFVYEKTNRNKRAFLRIEIDTSNRVPVRCILKSNSQSLAIEGAIGDLSMNGLQIILKHPEMLDRINLKDFMEVAFSIGNFNIKIHKALIARIDRTNHSIGLYFEIHNENMIKSDFAEQYTGILYQMIKEILKTENS